MAFLHQIQQKWQKKWQDARVFQANANPYKKKKFFLTFPYPYVNGLPHIGHLFTIMRVEVFARYKKLQGHNVLFPQGWHATGSPIVDAAQRVKEQDEKQLAILKDCGISDKDIVKFADSKYWVEYFPPEYKKDLQALGLAIDWRREFYTTELNPYYDKFIRWQFSILKEKGYVKKGKFPVVWDTKNNCPVPDHSRVEGEGEIPQEFLLIKHRLDNSVYLVTATLRPDTILGVTNLYVHPDIMYVRAKVSTSHGTEEWILSRKVIVALKEQDKDVRIMDDVPGSSLIGKMVLEFSGNRVPVLPAFFVEEQFGTGLVHSVPSDSADDLIALDDLKKDTALCEKYKLDIAMVRNIEPIPVLDVPGFGKVPARDALVMFKVKNQHDREKLDKAKDLLYKKAFYEGKLNALYKKGFSKDYSGQPVQRAKDNIKQEILASSFGDVYYQLTGRVVSRSMTECIVKIVEDQWFIDYGDEHWKKLAHDALNNLKLYPEKARAQFTYVIDWLHQWACTRETGLGTRLPWDEKWLIESLSDSTIYTAFYTITHILQKVAIASVNDALFDYIFLDKEWNQASMKGVDKALADEMKREFEYWYPVDFRNSGKDLIQNHLTFYLFNHTAIFHKNKWPTGIGVNGWVTVDGKKMSKSLGNMIPVREMVKVYSADAARITILSGGESLDDPNWDTEFARSITSKMEQFFALVRDYSSTDSKGRQTMISVDHWAVSTMHHLIREATKLMEETMFRSAIQKIFFDVQRLIKWYLRRTNNNPNRTVIKELLEAQVIMLSPFTPHLCEEAWEVMRKKSFVAEASWPVANEHKIDEQANAAEELVQSTMADIQQVMKLAKMEKPSAITLFVSSSWKYSFFRLMQKELEKTRNPKDLLAAAMKTDLRQHGNEIMKIVPKLCQSGVPAIILSQEKELAALQDACAFFKEEFRCDVSVVTADASGSSGEQKAKQAQPGKAAIVVA